MGGGQGQFDAVHPDTVRPDTVRHDAVSDHAVFDHSVSGEAAQQLQLPEYGLGCWGKFELGVLARDVM